MLVVPKQRRSAKSDDARRIRALARNAMKGERTSPVARAAGLRAAGPAKTGVVPEGQGVPAAAAVSPGPVGIPLSKRVRSASAAKAAGVRRSSFEGAKKYIAQLQKAEAEAVLNGVTVDNCDAGETTGTATADAAKAPKPSHRKTAAAGREPNGNALHDFDEEDAIMALSGLSGEPGNKLAHQTSGTLQFLGIAKAPRQRRSKPSRESPASAGTETAAAVTADETAATTHVAPLVRSGSTAAAAANTKATAAANDIADSGRRERGPSASRKAADHRRLLKSYMKALFRHLNLAVDHKVSESATYRDRINNTLAFWFGDSFAPGKATQECHAPKIMGVIMYLATSGRVSLGQEEVHEILQKGLQAKNANYTVNDAALEKHDISIAELRTLFEGHARMQDGFPRGLPLQLPPLNKLPPPVMPRRTGRDKFTGEGEGMGEGAGLGPCGTEALPVAPRAVGCGGVDACASSGDGVNGVEAESEATTTGWTVSGAVVKGARSKRSGSSGSVGGGSGGGSGDDVKAPKSGRESEEGKGEVNAAVRKTVKAGAGGRGKGAGTKEIKPAPFAVAAPNVVGAGAWVDTAGGASFVFSPVGTFTAACAAAALMPQVENRSATVTAFIQNSVRPMLDAVASYPVETQLEVLNCAQGELARYVTALVREQHAAAGMPGAEPGMAGMTGAVKGSNGSATVVESAREARRMVKAEMPVATGSGGNGTLAVKRKRSRGDVQGGE